MTVLIDTSAIYALLDRTEQLLRGTTTAAAAAPPVRPPASHTQLRHTCTHEALSAGMQEGAVMALAGWRSREMLSLYAQSAERERGIAAARPVDDGIASNSSLGGRLVSVPTFLCRDRQADAFSA